MRWENYFAKCRLSDDGILHCTEEADVTTKFSAAAQNGLFEIEDTSWWFQYRSQVICRIAHKFLNEEHIIFDVVGGNGYTTNRMALDGYCMALLEPSPAACRNAKRRGLRTVICGTLEEETVIDDSMEQLLLLDVLEHIEDDGAFLQTMYRKLAPGGRVLLTVPAFQRLWSSEDDEARHYRRYRLEQLKDAAQNAGFEVLYSNYFFEFLFLPILFVRVGLEKLGLLKRTEERTAEEKKRITEKQFKERQGIVQFVLSKLESWELKRLMGGKRVRFGSSAVCVLQKRSPSPM